MNASPALSAMLETATPVVAPVVAPPAPVVVPSDLSCRAMLASLHVTQWTARKIDRKATADVHERNAAQSDAGRYNKLLIAKEALAEVTACVSEARSAHYAMTQPWLDEGGRILAAGHFAKYAERQRAIRDRFEAAADRFVASYDVFVQAARARLGDLFDGADYPSSRLIRSKFAYRSVVLPVPTAGDFRVGLSQGQADQVRAEIEESTREALQRAQKDAWTRIADVTSRVVDRLTAYRPAVGEGKAEGVFRDSLVENIRDLVDVLPGFNLTGDPAMASVTERLKVLTLEDASALRNNESLRKGTAELAADILAEVSDYL